MVMVAWDYVDVDRKVTQPAEDIPCALAAYLVVFKRVSSHEHEVDLILSGDASDRVDSLKPRCPHSLGNLRDMVGLHSDLPIRRV
jgi:hypothetical protein